MWFWKFIWLSVLWLIRLVYLSRLRVWMRSIFLDMVFWMMFGFGGLFFLLRFFVFDFVFMISRFGVVFGIWRCLWWLFIWLMGVSLNDLLFFFILIIVIIDLLLLMIDVFLIFWLLVLIWRLKIDCSSFVIKVVSGLDFKYSVCF